jgi:hypothetical protein
MPIPPEMNAFEAEVGGDQQFAPGGYAQDGAVVPDTPDNFASRAARLTPTLSGSRHPANFRNQQSFRERHVRYYTAE